MCVRDRPVGKRSRDRGLGSYQRTLHHQRISAGIRGSYRFLTRLIPPRKKEPRIPTDTRGYSFWARIIALLYRPAERLTYGFSNPSWPGRVYPCEGGGRAMAIKARVNLFAGCYYHGFHLLHESTGINQYGSGQTLKASRRLSGGTWKSLGGGCFQDPRRLRG